VFGSCYQSVIASSFGEEARWADQRKTLHPSGFGGGAGRGKGLLGEDSNL
jgi:hypothetical protein